MSQSIDSNCRSCPSGKWPHLNGEAARAGPRRLAPAARVAHVDAKDHAEDLVDRLKVVNVGEGLADVSADTCTPVPGLQGGPATPHQTHTSAEPAAANKQMSDIDNVRLERRRARNRASQRKARQNLRKERSALQLHLAQLQQQISRGRASLASLHQQRLSTRKRLTAATSVLVGLETRASQSTRSDLHADTAAGASAHPLHSGGASDVHGSSDGGGTPGTSGGQGSAPDVRARRWCGCANSGTVPPARALARRSFQPPRTPDAALPRVIASFDHSVGISYGDIVESTAGAAEAGDSRMCMQKVLEQCRFRKAWALYSMPAEVCWFVQTQYEVSRGVPLSYSTTLSSPECVASMAMHFLVSCLEFSLFTTMQGPTRGDPSLQNDRLTMHMPPTYSAPCGGSPTPGADPAKPRRTGPPPEWLPLVTPHSTQRDGSDTGVKAAERCSLPPLHGSPRHWTGGPTPGAGPPTAPLPPLPPTLPDGAPVDRPPAAHVRRCEGRSRHEAPADALGVAAAPKGGGAATEPPPAGKAWSGNVRCGVNETCNAHTAVAALVRAVHTFFHGHVSPAELKWAYNQTASHLDDLLFATFAPAVSEGADTVGGEYMSGVVMATDTEAGRYHAAITEAMSFILPALHMHLLNPPDSAPRESEVNRVHQVRHGHVSGVNVNHAGANTPSGADPGQLRGCKEGAGEVPPSMRVQERADRAMTLYSGGHLLVLKDANRVVRNLSVNGTKPLIQQFEVENMNVRVYRSLQLTQEQRAMMRAVWLEWERNRRRLDEPVATARTCLNSLPTCIPIPPSFAQRVFDIADAKIRSSEVSISAVLEHPAATAPWDHKAVVPLLGAAAEFSGFADEALRLLWYAQQADVGVGNYMICQRLEPGRVLSMRQQMRLYSSHLLFHGAPFVDFLALCQQALTHHRRDSLILCRDDPYCSSTRGEM